MSKFNGFTKIGRCEISRSTRLNDGSIIGKQFRPLLSGTREGLDKTVLKSKVYIGYYSIIGSGSIIGEGAIIDDFSIVESRVKIGKKSILIYRAQVCNDVLIGDNCVIGGLIGENSVVGNGCRIFGKIVHSQLNPHLGWDDDTSEEAAPRIGNFVFIGFDAIVAGGVTIGPKVYICAGAVVTKDVPSLHVVSGVNKLVHFSKWPGRLGLSKFFQ